MRRRRKKDFLLEIIKKKRTTNKKHELQLLLAWHLLKLSRPTGQSVCVSVRDNMAVWFLSSVPFSSSVLCFLFFFLLGCQERRKKKSLCLLKINFHWLNFKYGTRRSLFFQPASYSHCHIATGKKNIYFFFRIYSRSLSRHLHHQKTSRFSCTSSTVLRPT